MLMYKLTNKQYEEYQRLCHARDHGQMLTPDGLRLICAGFDYDPEKIGKHMLEMLAKFRNEGLFDIPTCEDEEE
jgi:hypothetical protein